MTEQQVLAVKCAYADLLGALQNYEKSTYHEHDWNAHQLTIEELEAEFPFLTNDHEDNKTEDQNHDNP